MVAGGARVAGRDGDGLLVARTVTEAGHTRRELYTYVDGRRQTVHGEDGRIVESYTYTPDGRPGGITDTMRRIAADLNESGTPTTLMEHLELARWQKLVWNVPYNGLSVVLNATTDRIMADPHGRKLSEALMLEVVEGAGARGLPIDRAVVEDMLSRTERMTPYRTSMMIDHDRGKPMEVEAIFGAPLREAKEAGASTPMLEMVYELLKFMDGSNRAAGGQGLPG